MTAEPVLEDPAGDDMFGDPADPDAPDGDKPYPAKVVRGRYSLPDPKTGKERKYSRASTIAGTIKNRWHLDRWNDRMIVKGMALRPDLVTLAGATDLDEKETLQDIAEDAKTAAGARQGANHGTALHSLAEKADRGQELPPGTHKVNVAGVETYQEALEAAGVRVVSDMLERVILCEDLGQPIVGRLDRVVEVDPVAVGLPAGDPFYAIGDLKTGKTMDFGAVEMAIQLSIYSRAKYMYDEYTGDWIEIQMDIHPRYGVIMHLPSTGKECTIYLINLDKGWAYAHLAMDVRASHRDKSLLKPIITMDTNPWTRAIMKAQTKEELSAIWRSANKRGEWNTKLEAFGKRRLAIIANGKDE